MGQHTNPAVTYPELAGPTTTGRMADWLARHWLLAFGIVWGLYVGLPWLAPVLMQIGATGPAQALYAFYSTQCHQLPERSFFLFGPKLMYSLPEIQAAFLPTRDTAILRQFIGSAEMGWKVAWSDRMVSFYTSMLMAALVYARVRWSLSRLPLWSLVLLMLPMALDGGTHLVSDVLGRGVGLGFRDSNVWLAALTGSSFPAGFYAGDALWSFNWLMRLITGILAGVGLVWFAFPFIDAAALETMRGSARHPRDAYSGQASSRIASGGPPALH
jgi:uncharacterized membrane protein